MLYRVLSHLFQTEITGEEFKLMEWEQNEEGDITAVIYQGKKYLLRILKEQGKLVGVFVDGLYFPLKLVRPIDILTDEMGYNGKSASEQQVLHAPMPGQIMRINIEPGDSVSKGTVLLTLQAMKMENLVIAPHDTRIKKIMIRVGDTVQKNQEMIEFDSEI